MYVGYLVGTLTFRMAKVFVFALLISMIGSVLSTKNSKILMIPALSKSHIMCAVSIGQQLVQNGHFVDIAVGNNYGAREELVGDRFRFLSYSLGEVEVEKQNQALVAAALEGSSVFELSKLFGGFLDYFCRMLLFENEDFIRDLQAQHYDLVILDAFFMTKCIYLVPHRLRVPHVSIVDAFEPWLARLPWFPSTVPNPMIPFSDRMNFAERTLNTLASLGFIIIPSLAFSGHSYLEKYRKYGPVSSLNDVVDQTQLWLYTSDPLMDYPKPSMPNIVNVGGLTTSPAKPLPTELSELIKSSSNGFLLVSFGSAVVYMNPTIASRLLTVFGKLDLLVIWRFDNRDNLTIPQNVHLMKWLPQNDLLGSKNIKLFMSHCGKNGLFEALYHGVPIVGSPLAADQSYNARIISDKGYGEIVDIFTFTVGELYTALSNVLEGPIFRQNIQLASKMFHDRPSPAKRAVFWVEHILKFGGDHLRSKAFELSWYQYLMLDVLALFMFVFLLVTTLTWKVVKCCYMRCKRPPKVKKQ